MYVHYTPVISKKQVRPYFLEITSNIQKTEIVISVFCIHFTVVLHATITQEYFISIVIHTTVVADNTFLFMEK